MCESTALGSHFLHDYMLFIEQAWYALRALSGVADEWLDTGIHRQPERARGVRADAVGSGRGNQPGDGGLPNLDGKVLRGLCVCGDVREAPCMHVQLVGCAGMARGGVCGRVVVVSGWHMSGMGQHPDHRLQQSCGRGCTVRTVWCCRRMAGHHCTSPARKGMWSACGHCWIGARR